MYCKKPSPISILLVNTLIVAVTCVIVDLVYINLISKGPNPYSTDLSTQIILTLLFSLVFAHLYNRSSRIWRPNSDEAFIFKNKVVNEANLCDISLAKILNGIIFSLLVSGVMILAMELGKLLMTTLYLDLLHGFRGGGDSALPVVKTVVAGVALEWRGRTEDDPNR